MQACAVKLELQNTTAVQLLDVQYSESACSVHTGYVFFGTLILSWVRPHRHGFLWIPWNHISIVVLIKVDLQLSEEYTSDCF